MTEHLDVVILGAGFSGIGLGIKLLQDNKTNFAIIEQADAIGGTWRDNVYPGAGCDTESHLYCFSFALNPSVSRVYARQPEILAYIKRISREHGLDPYIRLNTTVTSAVWDDQALVWNISLKDGSVLIARNFVAAWGQLNRPQIPRIPGQDDFTGVAFHSARWPRDVALNGKRVASIGNAASAVQYVPEIAPIVAHLDVFQRSPNWIVPRLDRPYTEAELAEYNDGPGVMANHRQALFEWRESTFLRMKQGSDEALALEQAAIDHLRAQIGDETLRERLTPDYPLGCKRILRSDDYYPALCRDNVELITAGIERIEANGILTNDGKFHEVDVIVYGTGFETQSFQGPVEVTGRAGQDLRESWRDGAHAYLGTCVSGFPNFFLMYGPNTNLGHNSILSMLESQFDFILQALHAQLSMNVNALEVKLAVSTEYNADLQKQMKGAAWSGGCTSWYKNAAGQVINNWTGTVQEFQEKTSRLREDAFLTYGASE